MAKKTAARKAATKKTAARKGATKKTAARTSGAKKTGTRKTAAKKGATTRKATRKTSGKTSGAASRGAARRTLVDTGSDKRFVRRNAKGQIKESDDVGRSLSGDQRRKARTKAKPGQGDKGDR